MRAVIQRVRSASVSVGDTTVGRIDAGLLVLLGVHRDDVDADAAWLAEKTAALRIMPDADGKMNRSVLESGGGILVVSQFTLYGDCQKGRRPSFVQAGPPEIAQPLYEHYVEHLRSLGVPTATGVFGAEMLVELANDGPVTIILESPRERNE